MATLATLTTTIEAIIRDESITDLTTRINDAVTAIAGGIRLPDGRFSPPLPELYASTTVATTTNAYADLPTNYQRGVFYVADDSGDRILPPVGGDYYSFVLFLNGITEKDMSEAGEIYRVAVKGRQIYYQGIPSVTEDLTVMYYKKPTDMSSPSDEPDGIPDQFQVQLIKHYVCADIMGDILEDGKKVGFTYHKQQFYAAMIELIDFVGDGDGEPSYYRGGGSEFTDGAVCD